MERGVATLSIQTGGSVLAANVSARSAVFWVVREIDLTTILLILITISVPLAAHGNATLTIKTRT